MLDPTPPVASEDAAERFWRLCEENAVPNVDDFLTNAGQISLAARGTILRIDQRYRWQRGERVSAETYLQKHCEISHDAETAVDLIFNEYLVREQCGDQPDVAEFLRRFPEHGDVLRAQIELHQAVLAEPATRTGDHGVDFRPLSLPEVPGYEVLEEIGHGGMGIVYRARQLRPQRLVALKMLLSPAHASPERRQRFLAEADAIAGLQHPNIVQVHAVGENGGVPYLVLEYVSGGNLARKLDRRPLHARPAAELIEALAGAVHYAHQSGVVHRDLKPANILLASRSGPSASDLPKISDFGLAKQEGPGMTLLGDLLGTPSYMAPEQTRGDGSAVGPAADIYALGVILYEALTGRVPFLAASVLETLEQVRNSDPAPPRKLTGSIPRDLETICLKCLEKEARRRYATAQDLADDCRRFLDGRPVLARPIGRRERLRRWCRRNPLAASLAGALAALLVASLVGLTALYLHADAERQHADVERQRAESAEINWRAAAKDAKEGEAKAVQSQLETKAILDFFTKKVMAAARPKGQEGGLGPDASIRAAIDQAEPGIAKSLTKQPLAEASLRQTLGITYWFMGLYPQSIAQHERELALRSAKLPADHPDVLNAMAHLAQAYQAAGRTPDALKLHRKIFELRKVVLGPDDTETLWTMNRLATTLHTAGRLSEALPLLEENLRRARKALKPDEPDTLIYMSYLAMAYRDLGRLPEALALIQATVDQSKKRLGSEHPDTLASMHNLATVYHEAGRFGDAVKLQEQTIKLRRARLRPDHPDTLNSVRSLAEVYVDIGRPTEAIPLLENAWKIEKVQDGPDHHYTLTIMAVLAKAYEKAERLPEAMALYQETLRLQESKLGADHFRRLIVINDLGRCLLKMKRLQEASNVLRQCLSLRTKRDPADWWILETKCQLGQVLAGTGHVAEAKALLTEAASGLSARKEKIPGRYRHFVGEAAQALAQLQVASNK